MLFHHSHSRSGRGFTLIEMLVVIAIIALLLGLAVPVIFKRLREAKATEAKNSITTLVTAVDSFSHDHNGSLPIPPNAKPYTGEDSQFTTSDKNDFMNILMNRERGSEVDKINQRGTAYGQFKDTDNKQTGGLLSTGSRLGLFDPWGNPFIVIVDENGDGEITNPAQPNAKLYNKKVVIYSLGPDGKDETAEDREDNVYSFK